MTEQIQLPTYQKPDKETQEYYAGNGYYGVMYSENYEWDVQKVVREAYNGEDAIDGQFKRSLCLHTRLLPPHEAAKCIAELPESYNSFKRDHVRAFILALPEDARVSVARESSPALYVLVQDEGVVEEAGEEHLGRWTHTYTDIYGKERTGTWNSRPDEYSVYERGDKPRYWRDVPAGRVLVRMWWD